MESILLDDIPSLLWHNAIIVAKAVGDDFGVSIISYVMCVDDRHVYLSLELDVKIDINLFEKAFKAAMFRSEIEYTTERLCMIYINGKHDRMYISKHFNWMSYCKEHEISQIICYGRSIHNICNVNINIIMEAITYITGISVDDPLIPQHIKINIDLLTAIFKKVADIIKNANNNR